MFMKNWETLEADVNMILNKHFTSGRSGKKINKIVIHHNAGNLTVQGCYNTWQTREASAHYQVESSGKIGQLVWDKDTAWHAGDWNANLTSIGIEHADITANPWKISEACLDNGAHLVAALCKYYGLGEPTWKKNVFPHSYFSSTGCPASLQDSQNAEYMARAKKYYAEMTGGKPSTPSTPQTPSKPSSDKPQVLVFTYAVKAGGKIYPEVKNLEDYAGVPGVAITDVAIKVNFGSVKYRVHVKGGGWLPYVTGYNWKDFNNGYAGCGKVIDAIEVYYTTPADYAKKYGYKKAQYRVSPLNGNYYPWQYDNETSGGQDGYAGTFGKAIDRFQLF